MFDIYMQYGKQLMNQDEGSWAKNWARIEVADEGMRAISLSDTVAG